MINSCRICIIWRERERERERERKREREMFSVSFFKHREYQMSQSKKINDRRKTRTCITLRVLKYGEKIFILRSVLYNSNLKCETFCTPMKMYMYRYTRSFIYVLKIAILCNVKIHRFEYQLRF